MPRRLAGAVVAVLAAPLLAAPAAAAEDRGTVVTDQPSYQYLGTLGPGETLQWRITTWVEDAPAGAAMDLQLRAWGDLVERDDDLTIEVTACHAGEQTCSHRLVDRAPLRQVATRTGSDTWRVTSVEGDERTTLDVVLSLPGDAEDGGDLEGNVAVGIFASGAVPGEEDPDEDDVDDEPGGEEPGTDDDRPDLAETGAALGGLALLALGLTTAGAALRSRRKEDR